MRKSYARCLDLVEAGLIRRTAAFTYEDAELGEVWDDVVYRLVDDGLLALGEDGSVHTTTSRARDSRRPGRPGAGSARRPSPIRSPPRPKGPAHDDDHDPGRDQPEHHRLLGAALRRRARADATHLDFDPHYSSEAEALTYASAYLPEDAMPGTPVQLDERCWTAHAVCGMPFDSTGEGTSSTTRTRTT